MANVNIVILAGNLTRDPEIRYTPSGMAVAKLGLAVNRRFKDSKSGQLREETTFVDVDVWGRQAETASQYLSKGRPALIEGELRLDQWDDKQTGQKRSKLKVVARRVQFMGGGARAAGGGEGGAGAARPGAPARKSAGGTEQGAEAAAAPATVAEGEGDLEIPEEDIPF